jgi:hypothetical protein
MPFAICEFCQLPYVVGTDPATPPRLPVLSCAAPPDHPFRILHPSGSGTRRSGVKAAGRQPLGQRETPST